MEKIQLGRMLCEAFGENGEEIRYFFAPGRVNLLGEHIDYCGGLVFPTALTLGVTVAARKNGAGLVRMKATDLDGIYSFGVDNIEEGKNLKWGNYQAGVAFELSALGAEIPGMDMIFDCTVPFGAGLSSSAAYEIASGLAMATLSGFEIGMTELALVGQRAEHGFCNTNCGIMDQFASANGRKDTAMLLDCSEIKCEYVPLAINNYCIVLANTKAKHSLGSSKYNERRAEAERALEIMRKHCDSEEKACLCDYTSAQLCATAWAFDDVTVFRRALHIVAENERVKRAAKALTSCDLSKFGKLLCEGNDSIRYLYEVTGENLDAMIDSAKGVSGCIGSRMTGGGFGGCTVNIVDKDKVAEFCAAVGERYTARTGIAPEFYVCTPGDGAREI